ncbi:MAG: NAD(P)/FAD-dependent oxidoreductase [Silicimonas sp.]|nr:NAD(P)/FAD-dependent oxidoreductase [Silicimonas sp.]
MSAHHYDAVIVGARNAGAATAMLMARKGLRVLVIERAEPGTDTLSSHNITRGGVQQLVRWGMTDRIMEAGTPWIARSIFYFGDSKLPIDIKPVGRAPGILGTRRFILDRILAEAAKDAGAEIWYHTSFRDVIRNEAGRITGAIVTDGAGIDVEIHAPLIIGADGIRSTVARRVGAATRKQARNMLAHVYGYYRDLPFTENHAFFVNGASIASTPTNDGAHVVIASLHPDRLQQLRVDKDGSGILQALADHCSNGFGALLRDATPTEPVRIFSGVQGFARDCAGPGWALVGDASYFRDPVTAHGMTDAFRDAELLANAAALGDVSVTSYQQKRDAVTADIWDITDRIAAFDMHTDELQQVYHELAQAMRAEQTWMSEAFEPEALAA